MDGPTNYGRPNASPISFAERLVSHCITITLADSFVNGSDGRRRSQDGVLAKETKTPSTIGRASRFPTSSKPPPNVTLTWFFSMKAASC